MSVGAYLYLCLYLFVQTKLVTVSPSERSPGEGRGTLGLTSECIASQLFGKQYLFTHVRKTERSGWACVSEASFQGRMRG